MPTIMFTLEEIAGPLIARARDLSRQIVDLSDLKAKPLDPGESPDARRHKLAKLGKHLAEVFQKLDALMDAATGNVGEPGAAPGDPAISDIPEGTN